MKLIGTVEHIIYKNSENGYTVLSLLAKGRIITVSGKFPIIGVGEELELEGEFKVVARYGEQFVAESVVVNKPTDVDSIIKYLSSGLISGVGEVTARNIVNRFGEDTLKVIENDYTACEELSNRFRDVTVIHGDENEREILAEEGISGAGAFLSLTDGDEENILFSLFAKQNSKAKVVTKINRTDYHDIVKHLDLDTTIYPKSITSDMILRYVRATKNSYGSNVETMYNVIKGKVEASEFKIKADSPVCSAPLTQLHFKKDVLVAAILRAGKLIIPRGSDVILPGDSVVIVTKILGLKDISDILSD